MKSPEGLERVAVFANSYPPAYLGGGPARTLEALVREAPGQMYLHVLAPSRDLDGSELLVQTNEWIPGSRVSVLYAPVHTIRGLLQAFRMVRRTRPEVIYLNSFFDFRMSILPRLLSRVRYWGTPKILLAPRGEFNDGALRVRSAKKRLFLCIYKAIGLHAGITWHASTALEAAAVRRLWGDSARILVREDETSLPATASDPLSHSGELRAVYLGRIVPNKGLLIALRALKHARGQIVLEVYGPDEDARYFRECKLAAEQCPPNVAVRFRGAIEPDEVREMLTQMDVMLMPTSGENFGHVIAEALSVSCPVICSAQTPWTSYLQSGGGSVVETTSIHEWKEAIERFSLRTADERLALRVQAGNVYGAWKRQSKGPHVLSMIADAG